MGQSHTCSNRVPRTQHRVEAGERKDKDAQGREGGSEREKQRQRLRGRETLRGAYIGSLRLTGGWSDNCEFGFGSVNMTATSLRALAIVNNAL